MFSLGSSFRPSIPYLDGWKSRSFRSLLHSKRRIAMAIVPCGVCSSPGEGSSPLEDEASRDLFGVEVDLQPRNFHSGAAKLRSWFGPNGQYIRELPCPSCRGRGYTPCTECGLERSRLNCPECSGKGLKTCQKCFGDCVIWEESIDERPWEKARSSSPLKVKEDDEVDSLDIKLDIARRSKRVYQSPSREVGLKISRSLRSLNAKTGLFSKRMKIIHRDPLLRAQRVAAIKKTKGTAAARKQASEAMKAFFRDPKNRLKRSIIMKGVKYYCSHCGKEGHRRHYCPALQNSSGKKRQFRCGSCGELGHNCRTCERLSFTPAKESNMGGNGGSLRLCKACGQVGHNRRTCSTAAVTSSEQTRTYSCRLCFEKGHNVRTCPKRKDPLLAK